MGIPPEKGPRKRRRRRQRHASLAPYSAVKGGKGPLLYPTRHASEWVRMTRKGLSGRVGRTPYITQPEGFPNCATFWHTRGTNSVAFPPDKIAKCDTTKSLALAIGDAGSVTLGDWGTLGSMVGNSPWLDSTSLAESLPRTNNSREAEESLAAWEKKEIYIREKSPYPSSEYKSSSRLFFFVVGLHAGLGTQGGFLLRRQCTIIPLRQDQADTIYFAGAFSFIRSAGNNFILPFCTVTLFS